MSRDISLVLAMSRDIAPAWLSMSRDINNQTRTFTIENPKK